MSVLIRTATPADAAAVQKIYAPNVTDTPITFDYEVPDIAFFEKKIEALLTSHTFLVAEHEDQILGFAYASEYRSKAAYKFSAETTVYLAPKAKGKGIGTLLYQSLLDDLSTKGFHVAVAGITVPNDASIALHAKLGFEKIGIQREIGRKFDAWHDVEFWQKTLS